MSAPARAALRATPGSLALAFGLNLALGATYFGTKHALEGLPEMTVVAVRTVVAAALLVPLTGLPALRVAAGLKQAHDLGARLRRQSAGVDLDEIGHGREQRSENRSQVRRSEVRIRSLCTPVLGTEYSVPGSGYTANRSTTAPER